MHLRKLAGFAGILFALSGCAGRPATPDGDVSARPVQAGYGLIYPKKMLDAGTEGEADVSCIVTVEGATADCVVVKIVGSTLFGDAALQYVKAARYRPAIRGGVPVQTQHSFVISFKLDPLTMPQEQMLSLLSPDWSHCFGTLHGHAGQDAADACTRALAMAGLPVATQIIGYQVRARSDTAINRPDLAVTDLGTAIELGDLSTETYRARGQAYLDLHDYAHAAADFDFLLKTALNDPRAFRAHAEARVGQGDFGAAERDLGAALGLRPDDPSLHIQRASVLLAAGDTDKALADLDAALALNPTEVPALLARCDLYRKTGRTADAAADCARAETLDPKHKVSGAWPA